MPLEMETFYTIYAQDSPESVTRTFVASHGTHLDALMTFTSILIGGGTCMGFPYIVLEKTVRSYGNKIHSYSTTIAEGYIRILDEDDMVE
jgi:hypothetical protein